MKDENNEMKNDWILESLVRNNPFVLPSLEELQRMNNDLWTDEEKGYGNAFDDCLLHPLKEKKRNEISSLFKEFSKKEAYSISEEFKKISLVFNIDNLSFGSDTTLRSVDQLVVSKLEMIKGLIEFSYENQVLIPEHFAEIGVDEDHYYVLSLKDGAVYAYKGNIADIAENNIQVIDGKQMLFPSIKIANDFDLYFRGSVYAGIIYQTLVNEAEDNKQSVNIKELKRLTLDIHKSMGENIDYHYWEKPTGFISFDLEERQPDLQKIEEQKQKETSRLKMFVQKNNIIK